MAMMPMIPWDSIEETAGADSTFTAEDEWVDAGGVIIEPEEVVPVLVDDADPLTMIERQLVENPKFQ